ncbi:MAG TPA: hypothetical protein VGR57_18140 [Ktedonobacterales bacterium]|nr:hypothetical protein [Ktedonobacterales bacterium]
MAQRVARRAAIPSAAMPRWAAVALLAASLLGLSTFMAWEVPRISHVTAAHTDFIETLYGLRAFATGRDPYGTAVAAAVDRAMAGRDVPLPSGAHREHPFDYLLPPALLYLPATWLPDETAIIAVRALTVALYLTALAALVWRFAGALPTWAQGGLLFIGLAWWPFLAVILPIVQQAGTVFALLALAALAAERDDWQVAGLLCIPALLKPTESAPLVLALALWAARAPAARRRYFTGLAALGLPLAALAFIVRPTWPADWLRAVLDLRAANYSYMLDPPGVLAGWLHLPAALLWALVAAAWAAWAVALWRAAAPDGPRRAGGLWWWLALGAVLTLLLIPRTGSYDLVIGLIAWCVALCAATARRTTAGRAATLALVALLLGTGLLAYRDHAALEYFLWATGLAVALWLCRDLPLARAGRPQALTLPTVEASDGA